jgi:hypothetical protein
VRLAPDGSHVAAVRSRYPNRRGVIVGKLLYGDSEIVIEFDDRAMAHLQIVIAAKLRRKESFFFSWKEEVAAGGGRSSIWFSTSIPLYFKFYGGKLPTINLEWVKILSASANSSRGLVLTDEPGGVRMTPPRTHV